MAKRKEEDFLSVSDLRGLGGAGASGIQNGDETEEEETCAPPSTREETMEHDDEDEESRAAPRPSRRGRGRMKTSSTSDVRRRGGKGCRG